VARPGHRSRHNLKYWEDGSWLGFGCGAHSTIGAERWHNVPGTAEYIDRVAGGVDPAAQRTSRSWQDRLAEALFTGLRLADGVDLAALRARYGIDAWDRFGDALRPHVTAGRLVVEHGFAEPSRAAHPGGFPDTPPEAGRLRLTREGMLVANDVLTAFV
jgi:oxygen-independent coproporphyrinogen III oxidase